MKGIGEQEYYLGCDIIRTKNSRDTINKNIIKNICDKIERTTLKNYYFALEGGFHPEVHISSILDEEEVFKYRMLMGSMN